MISGDLGGTNGRLQLWTFLDSDPLLKFSANYRILEYGDLIELLKQFVNDSGFDAQSVCILLLALFAITHPSSWWEFLLLFVVRLLRMAVK